MPLNPPLGRFDAGAVLGTGGTSVVYEVRDPRREGEALALKVLREELALSPDERRRFIDEAARIGRVRHPALVRLAEAGELPDGRPYLLMPRLTGGTLAARLERGPLAVPEALHIAKILASAVSAVHAAGMVHRDIKPENVALEATGPVLLDFGIARELAAGTGTTTSRGHVRGTPAYMAPERFFGAPATVASDVYELGVVVSMMLTGRLPWSDDAQAAERLHPRSPEGPGVSRQLAQVVLRALSTRPEVRPASAEELARELEAAVADGAPRARPGERAERTTADLPSLEGPASPPARPSSSPVEQTATSAPPRDTTRVRSPRVLWGALAAVGAFAVSAGLVATSRPAPSKAPTSLALRETVGPVDRARASVDAEGPATVSSASALWRAERLAASARAQLLAARPASPPASTPRGAAPGAAFAGSVEEPRAVLPTGAPADDRGGVRPLPGSPDANPAPKRRAEEFYEDRR